MRIKLSDFLETLSEEREVLQAKIEAIDAVVEAYQPTEESPGQKKITPVVRKNRNTESRGDLCPCGRDANHKGFHRAGAYKDKIAESGVDEFTPRKCSIGGCVQMTRTTGLKQGKKIYGNVCNTHHRLKMMSNPERKERLCGSCKKTGHNYQTCPNRTQTTEERPSGDIKQRVQALQSQGFNSIQIATKLGITLKTVNENWGNPKIEEDEL